MTDAPAAGAPAPPNPLEISALVDLVNRDRLAEAESRALALIRLSPRLGILWKVLSVAQLRQGKDALQALAIAAELMPGDAEANRNLGVALNDRGKWAAGLECLMRALALAPGDVDSMVDAADALRALRRPMEAVPLYQRAIATDGERADAHNNLGNAYLELGRPGEAVECFRAAARLRPDAPQVLGNLGVALRQLGRHDEALAASRRALELDPRLAIAHDNLGMLLSAGGQPDEAIASFRRAVELAPGFVDALNHLGTTLRDVGQRNEAVGLHRRATEADPGSVESHWMLGTALFELKRPREAIESFRRALELNARFAPAHLGLALAFRQQRRPAEAQASCREALSIDPANVDAVAFLGELEADAGHFAEAESLFRRAIELKPDFAAAYFSIASHRRMTIEDRAWLAGAEALVDKPLPLSQQVGLHYALGKYWDDVREFDRAFESYRRANELTKRFGATYDRARLERTVDQLLRRFDADFLRRLTAFASASELPVLVVGMPRSGTSLAEQILASHPDVRGVGEVPFWDRAYGAFGKAGLDEAAAARVLPDIARDYLLQLGEAQGAKRIVDKMPANFLYLGLVHATFPKARIIHMRRHPIDTCLSIYFQNFFGMGPYANDLEDLAHYYTQYLRVTDHWRTLLPSTAFLEVPYEALIEDQETWTRRMLEFVGLPWDPRCLNFHETDRVVITASKWQVRQKIHGGSAGRWRHYARYVQPLERLLGPEATREAQ